MVNQLHIESQITIRATTTYSVYAQEGQQVHNELVTIIPLNILISVLISQLYKHKKDSRIYNLSSSWCNIMETETLL